MYDQLPNLHHRAEVGARVIRPVDDPWAQRAVVRALIRLRPVFLAIARLLSPAAFIIAISACSRCAVSMPRPLFGRAVSLTAPPGGVSAGVVARMLCPSRA